MLASRSLIAALTLALALVAAPAAADPQPSTVDELSATVSGQEISVSGSANFGGQDPVEVGVDGTGDSPVSQGLGLDIDRLLIQRPDGSAGNLIFTLDLDGLTGGGIPELFQYNWDISVDGGADAGGTNWSIKAMRSGQASEPGQVGGWAALYTCVTNPTTGGFSCSPLASLPSAWDQEAGEIRITVPLFRIDATAGSTIDAWARNGQPVWVRTSAAGALTGFVEPDNASHDRYTVPGDSVRLALAPAGTPEQFVDFNAPATLAGTDFTGTLTASEPGTYDVYAKACFGGNCGTAKRTVTVG